MITVLGASGFVGSQLIKSCAARNIPCYAPPRDEDLREKNLGDLIYSIGLTADFRSRPFDTVEAHVGKLKYVLESCDFNSFTYLSSTRIYIHSTGPVSETSLIGIDVANPFDLFNASKITGELLALNCGKKNIRVARLSNIYGNDHNSANFLTSIIKDALTIGKILLRTTPDSAKDYIGIEDVADLLLEIALAGKQTIYNVASGVNTPNSDILAVIQKATGCAIEYSPAAERIIFPAIRIDRLKQEFGYDRESRVLKDLVGMVDEFRNAHS